MISRYVLTIAKIRILVQTSLTRTWQDQEKLPAALQFLPPTKTREPDPVLRQTHVETLLLLCTTHWGREYLRNHGVYEVVRTLHEKEEVVAVSILSVPLWTVTLTTLQVTEHVLRLVNLLKREGGTDTIHDGADISAAAAHEESDDEDSKIEEL